MQLWDGKGEGEGSVIARMASWRLERRVSRRGVGGIISLPKGEKS